MMLGVPADYDGLAERAELRVETAITDTVRNGDREIKKSFC